MPRDRHIMFKMLARKFLDLRRKGRQSAKQSDAGAKGRGTMGYLRRAVCVLLRIDMGCKASQAKLLVTLSLSPSVLVD
jgi:hypothetical protein